MSLYDYKASLEIAVQNQPFYALIMAAMRQADTKNAHLLKMVFPHVHEELKARYNAPGGNLPDDGSDTITVRTE